MLYCPSYIILNCPLSPTLYNNIGELLSRILSYGYLYRRPPNLRDKLIRSRIPDPPRMRPKRLIPGMKPCDINCPTFPYIEPGTVIQSSNTSKKIEINGTFNCKTRNVVYCITCEKCKLQYIGQTTRSLDERVREHIGYIRNLHTNQPTGEHFNLPGH